jgi:DNA-binding response OmpR family regulator
MATTTKAAILPITQAKRELDSNSMYFLDEHLASVLVSRIPEQFRTLSRFLPVVVFVPKSAVSEKTNNSDKRQNDAVTWLTDVGTISSALDTTKTWFSNPSAPDTFEFGGITGCFSSAEIQRNGRPVALTRKEFKTLEYLIKNARRVISRDELLDKVWGYENYPCTRTVDNHILRLRQKLERDPSRPAHFRTVHGCGYKFLP